MLFLFLCFKELALSAAGVPPEGLGWVEASTAPEFQHDLQTKPLQFVKDSAFVTPSTDEIAAFFENSDGSTVFEKLRIIFTDPPEYKVGSCIGQKGFLSNFPIESNKIWEIQRIKDDSENKLVIHYDGQKVAEDDIKPECHNSEDKIVTIEFTKAPEYYRSKPAQCDALDIPSDAQATHSGTAEESTVVTVTCIKPQLYTIVVTCQSRDGGAGEWSTTPKCLEISLDYNLMSTN
ncbi:hypothetical protein ACHWQZ_G013212 [Mnemiopsis leidyi]